MDETKIHIVCCIDLYIIFIHNLSTPIARYIHLIKHACQKKMSVMQPAIFRVREMEHY